jgi:hypothetical protein
MNIFHICLSFVSIVLTMFSFKAFERILYVWSLRHPASSYVQGMNEMLWYPFHFKIFLFFKPSKFSFLNNICTPFFLAFLPEHISKKKNHIISYPSYFENIHIFFNQFSFFVSNLNRIWSWFKWSGSFGNRFETLSSFVGSRFILVFLQAFRWTSCKLGSCVFFFFFHEKPTHCCFFQRIIIPLRNQAFNLACIN